MSGFDALKQKFRQFNLAEKIIVINVVFFVLPFFLRTLFFLFNLPFTSFMEWVELSPEWTRFLFRPWTLFTYSFFHGSFSHILWNMILFYFASRLFLNLFTEKRLLTIYSLGVLIGGVVFVLSYLIFPVFKGQTPGLIGASAGVMAVLIFMCTYTPHNEVRILFFNLKLMYLGIALVVIDVLQIPSGNSGGHLAHIGGAALGYLYASQLLKGNDIGYGFEASLSKLAQLFTAKPKMETVHRKPKSSSTKTPTAQQAEIDKILDKISRSGYESLSKAEKDTLFNAGKD